MKTVKSPLTSISLSVLGWPIGILLGFVAVRGVGNFSAVIGSNVWVNLASIIVSPALAWLGLRWALPQEEITRPSQGMRFARLGVILLVVLVSFYGLFQLANLAMSIGQTLEAVLGSFSFLGYFLFQVGDIVAIITPALISGAIAERMKFSAYIVFIILWSTIVYLPIAHSVWAVGGWIRNLGALDFAGGLVTAVVDVASHFIRSGVIITLRDNQGRTTSQSVNPNGIFSDLPMVVLVNQYSASGSEVLSGALQDYHRATIAGTTTLGKGSYDSLFNLSDGSAIYLTIGRWLTPKGQEIEGKGITPDYTLTQTGDDEVQWAIDFLHNSNK